MTDNAVSELKVFRDNWIGHRRIRQIRIRQIDIEFEHWFNFAVKLGEEVNTVPSVPRLAKYTLETMVLYPIIRKPWCTISARISPKR